jgi:uncharacterized repeat protein (TIGR03803 family)
MKKIKLIFVIICLALYSVAQTGPKLISTTGGLLHDGNIFEYYGGDTISHLLLYNQYANHYTSFSGAFAEGPNGKLYGAADSGSNAYLVEYDYNSQTITAKASLPAGGSGTLFLAKNGRMYGNGYSYVLGDTFITHETYFSANGNGGKLTQGSDGYLYGMNYNGGAGSGSIFRYDLSTGTDTTLYYLPLNADPKCNLVEVGADTFYGVTIADGLYSAGTIFKYITNSNTYIKLYDFPYSVPSTGYLTLGSDGKLYGITQAGGLNNSGTLFSYDPKTNTYNQLHDFGAAGDGVGPITSLFNASNGILYGMTQFNQSTSVTLQYGSIYQYDPFTSVYHVNLFFNPDSGSDPQYSSFMEYYPQAAINRQPSDTRVCNGSTASFVAAASGNSVQTQWQVSTDNGVSYAAIPGAVDTVYNFTASLAQNGYKYRAIFTNVLAVDTSVAATLNVIANGIAAYFTLQPSSTPHLWYAVNQCRGQHLNYIWNWGDGTTSTGDTPSHTYDSAGYYQVCVTATDSLGCTASYCDTSVYLFKDQSSQMVYVNVVTQLPTGINTINAENLSISYYSGAIHFSEALIAPTQLRLYDMSGRMVMKRDDFGGSVWNIPADIAQGVYAIQLQNQSYSISRKLIITR